MEKIRLANNTELELIPNGLHTDDYGKRRTFTFISEKSYSEVEAELLNGTNLATVTYLDEAGEPIKTYADCVKLKILAKEKDRQITDDLIADVFIAEISVDETEKELQMLKDTVDILVLAGLEG